MDPVGNIFDLKKYAIHDGPGIRTTVFFKGCPLDCWWCHNPECRNGESADRLPNREATVAALMAELAKDEIFYDQSGGGVTFSGGEPMTQIDFLDALLTACRSRRFHTAVDTCGYAPAEDFDRIYDRVDMFLYDLKIMDDKAHTKYTGQSNSLILENLALLAAKGNKVKVRIPVIPDITDSMANIEAIIQFLAARKSIRDVSLLPYNLFGEDKFKRFEITNRLGRLSTPSDADMAAVADKFRESGFRVKIGG
jgi:pyruvate formate lyase activating enzyme